MITLAQAIDDEWTMVKSNKLCKDCKWVAGSIATYGPYIYERCTHPTFQFSKFSPIDGAMHKYNDDGVPLDFARLESKKCGPSGKLWEAKPPRQKSSLWGWLRCT